MATRSERLGDILANLRTSSPDIIGAAIISIDGFVIASVLPADREEDVLSAMAAAMLGIGERIAHELLHSEMRQLFVKADTGFVVLNAAGREAILVSLLSAKAKLGLVFLDTGRAATAVAAVL
ncbi:MAG: roadblock/LC7 domain-containing protein [Myxococcota bacterium]